MSSTKTKKPPMAKDTRTLAQVRAAFVLKGSSLNAFCIENNIDQGNATRAILGTWSGKKGKALRSLIIQASKTKPTTKPTEENSHE